MIARPLAAAIGAKTVISRGGPLALPRPLIDDIGPQPPGSGLAIARRQHRYGRVVGVDDWRRQDMDANQLGQRRRPPGGMPDPVGQGGTLDLDALARQDRRLAVERQPIEVLADHDIGDQTRPRPALRDMVTPRSLANLRSFSKGQSTWILAVGSINPPLVWHQSGYIRERSKNSPALSPGLLFQALVQGDAVNA